MTYYRVDHERDLSDVCTVFVTCCILLLKRSKEKTGILVQVLQVYACTSYTCYVEIKERSSQQYIPWWLQEHLCSAVPGM